MIIIIWSGDVLGFDVFISGEYYIIDLVVGIYMVEVIDDWGCSVIEIVSIVGVENMLDILIEVMDGICMSEGFMWVEI